MFVTCHCDGPRRVACYGHGCLCCRLDFLAIYDSQGYYVPLGSVFTMEVGQSESFGIQVFYADGSAIDAE